MVDRLREAGATSRSWWGNGDQQGPGEFSLVLRRLEQHREPADPDRAGGVLPERGAPPRAGWQVRRRAVGPGHPEGSTGSGRGALPTSAATTSASAPTAGDPAGHVPPLPADRRRHRDMFRSLLSGRPVRPRAARGDGAGEPRRRLARAFTNETRGTRESIWRAPPVSRACRRMPSRGPAPRGSPGGAHSPTPHTHHVPMDSTYIFCRHLRTSRFEPTCLVCPGPADTKGPSMTRADPALYRRSSVGDVAVM